MQVDWFVATVVVLAVLWAYRIGYGQGRNDGFHAGWRESQKQKRTIIYDPR
jgi:5-formyltetrahydrofolate cyclo-ligase